MNAPHADRLPPHSIDAEQAVLGGLMLDGSAYWRVADLLTDEDFYRKDHRLIYRAMKELAHQQQPLDAVTLGEWFESQKLAREIGGPAYLIELANTTPSAANVRAHAEIVASKAQARRLIDAGMRIAQLGYEASADALAEAHAALQRVSVIDTSAVKSSKEVLRTVVEDLQRKFSAESAITGLDTGFDGINDFTGGFQPGDLIIVAGRPSMGKSTLAQNCAERVALRGQRVLFFTQEMSAASVLTRSVAAIGGIPFGALRSPKLMDEAHWSRVMDAAERIAKAPLLLDETCGITVEQIEARARQCHSAAPLAAIFIDYLQYMRMPKADTQALAVQDVTRALKSLAKTLNVPVVLLSQLNRGVENRADKRPSMSDLRDSGAIEQDADLIVFMYRDEYYHADSPHKGYAEAIVAKQRNGRTGMIPLIARLDQMRFEDCDGLPEAVHERPTSSPARFGRQRDHRAAAAGE